VEATWRAAAAELVASGTFVFLAAGSVIVAGPSGAGLVGVALASGFAFAVAVALARPTSGGHVNPVVTIALWVEGRISSLRAASFVLAQLSGAVIGSLLLRAGVPEPMWQAAHLGTPLPAADLGAGPAVLLEAVLGFGLALAFLAVPGVGGSIPDLGPLLVGLVLAADVLAAGPLTGAGVSPARALGPGLVSGTWHGWWVYWVGPPAGGVLAALVHRSIFPGRSLDR
jgi:MIP family channel proteins